MDSTGNNNNGDGSSKFVSDFIHNLRGYIALIIGLGGLGGGLLSASFAFSRAADLEERVIKLEHSQIKTQTMLDLAVAGKLKDSIVLRGQESGVIQRDQHTGP